jgi:hypothetical protein
MPARSEPYYLGLAVIPQGCRINRRRIAPGNCKSFIYDGYVEAVAEEYGEMAERLNAPDSKSGIPSRVSGVQIPLSPPPLRVSSETFVPKMESLPQPDPQRRSGSHKNLDDGLCGWRESPPIWIFGSEYIIKPLDQDQLVAAVLPLSLHWTEVNEPAPLMPS